MSSSLTLTSAFLASLSDRIVEARRLHGVDSAYVIGLINGVNWLLESEGSSAELRNQFSDQILESETGKAPAAAKNPEPKANGDSPALEENSWIKGSVKWFNNDKGYGFISTDSDTDVFVHWRDISSWDRSLVQGDQVEFMVTKTAKGFQAVNVMKSETAGSEAPRDPRDVQDPQEHMSEGGSGDAVQPDGEPSALDDQGGADQSHESEPPTRNSSTVAEPVEEAATKQIEQEGESSQPDGAGETGFGVISSDNDTVDRYQTSESERNDTADSRFFAEGGEA